VRIIGVLDLAHGVAVHARAGKRDEYRPVQQVAAAAVPAGDARSVATAYRDRLGVDELYVADLDAITAGRPQNALVTALAAVAPLWLDAGVTSVNGAGDAVAAGAARVVVGLETLSSFDALTGIAASIGGTRTAFSLDLRQGRPVHAIGGIRSEAASDEIAVRAAHAGARTIIVIDLARVGTGRGLDLETIARVRKAAPDVALIAGGGLRGWEDISRLADAGCDGVLVATALQDGRMTMADVAAARRIQPSVSR
jgi:phosphoribosylformimino-5-aminoimidazole carboxamide ribotide isomerase